jgi:uncharacterized protein YecE (DUF72 family)
MNARAGRDQLTLFGVEGAGAVHGAVAVHVDDADRDLAARVPRLLRFGTSSWSFPGWRGVVWAGAPSAELLARAGLVAYAEHPLFRAVGLDRSYYGPLDEDAAATYAAQLRAAEARAPDLPPFRMVSKVWEDVSTAVFPGHARYGARAGKPNAAFLDAARFREMVLDPYVASGLVRHAGPFVVELTPMPRGALSPRALEAKVEHFLGELADVLETPAHPGLRLAFELRNEELLGPRWYDLLAAFGVAHVFTYWTGMPTIRAQLAAPRALGARFTVARLMLPRFARYEERKKELAPFDRLASPQPAMREDVVSLVIEAAEKLCDEVYVIVNNKAEGSAPLTIRALADGVARAFGR